MSTRIGYMVAWLALALWARAPAIAHAFTYAQQLMQLEQANQAFEQALTSPTPEAAEGYYRQAIAGYEQLIAAVQFLKTGAGDISANLANGNGIIGGWALFGTNWAANLNDGNNTIGAYSKPPFINYACFFRQISKINMSDGLQLADIV